MNEYKRIFVIVLDSLGIGAMPDSKKFGDEYLVRLSICCIIVYFYMVY